MSSKASGERILVMSHAHPDFSLGGGEIAAYNLFNAYRRRADVADAWFLARADRGLGTSGSIAMRRPGEYLWDQGISDWHALKAANLESVLADFADFLRATRPTIVHAHHYVHLGLEFLNVIRNVDPDIRIVLTLHEYMAICRNNGQMVKTDGETLCTQATDEDCRRCFPASSLEDFWLRRHGIHRRFDLVDVFIAPSAFLRDRYVAWGIAPERILVIENGQDADGPLPPRALGDGGTRNRFAFFGQVTPYKGLDVVLGGLSQLRPRERRSLVLEINGANLALQKPEYQARVQALLGPLSDEGVVQWRGSYGPGELRQRMAGIDWVVVPSTWWENSPMVIQEAFACGRPLLVSDIGGMQEKVRDGIDGLHVGRASRLEWGQAMMRAAAEPGLWQQLQAGIRQPLDHDACAAAHLAAFGGASDRVAIPRAAVR